MAKKKNSSAREIDLYSFAFVKGCGECHPGGGPAEYDRDGHRYDAFARDPANHIIAGGDNNFDGDYFRSHWAESGVLEADCLVCHVPDYKFKKRKKQIQQMNFKWAATAGAGFATIKGSVSKGQTPQVVYDSRAFQASGKVALSMVREIPSKNCLNCHRRPDWKKKGAVYQPRTDVHLRAGLKCVDCHVTGRKASDPRINGREQHQIGKGDDPTGLVRDDLDNSMRTCEDCHFKGQFKAPVAAHNGFPPIHLQKIACLTCHVPQRQVKGALVQDSTVFNDVPRIPSAKKKIWTFYGPDMQPWNLYGENSAFTLLRQPLFLHEPVRDWYKGKIYPMNRINSVWVAILADDNITIDQPYTSDLYQMWKTHRQNPLEKYPELALLRDDNNDGAPETNRPEEFKAVIGAVTTFLEQQQEPLEGCRVVVVNGTRFTEDGEHWQELAFKPASWQYSVYSSVFKLSHDIAPAAAALGAGGCTDCHSRTAAFWNRPVLDRLFVGPEAKSTFVTNATLLGLSPLGVMMSGVRHEWLEPLLYYGILASVLLCVVLLVIDGVAFRSGLRKSLVDLDLRCMLGILGVVALGPGIILMAGALISSHGIGILQNFHKIVAITFVVALGFGIIRDQSKLTMVFKVCTIALFYMVITGTILLFSDGLDTRQIVLTLHDIGAMILTCFAVVVLLMRFVQKRRR